VGSLYDIGSQGRLQEGDGKGLYLGDQASVRIGLGVERAKRKKRKAPIGASTSVLAYFLQVFDLQGPYNPGHLLVLL